MDQECIELCNAMNLMPGIATVESCCGHGDHPYHIWFWAEDIGCLPDLLYWFDSCHCGYQGWCVKVKTDCAKRPATFYVEGPVGEEAYTQALEIARLIEKDAIEIEQTEKANGD